MSKIIRFWPRGRRLKGLEEFKEPEWKNPDRFGPWGPVERSERAGPTRRDHVTFRGLARETLQWLAIFFIAGIIATSAWRWLYGG